MSDGKVSVVIPGVAILALAGLVAAMTARADDPPAADARAQLLTSGGERVEVLSDLSGPSSAGTNRYMIPAAAHAQGLEGTQWITDVVIHNPGDSAASVNAFFLKGGRDNNNAGGIQFLCDESTSMLASDMVFSAFAESSATGGILVGSEDPLIVSSRTYNTATSGTFGQYVPGLAKDMAIGQNDEARLIQLTRDASYRTNIGFSNDTDQMLAIRVDLYRANGSFISRKSFNLQPYGYLQATDIIGTEVHDAYAVVSSSTPGASYFAYASVVDNYSGDPVLVLPSESAGKGEVLYVPAAAHATGVGDTKWRTDLEIHNPDGSDASFRVELLERNQANSSPVAHTFSLGGGMSNRYDDALLEIFRFEGTGALRVTAASGEIIVTSRTYNDVSSGTYGQSIPGVGQSSAIVEGQSGRLIQLSYSSSDSSGFRTNIGFVNATGSTLTAKVELYTGSGELLGVRSYPLLPYEYDQVSNIFDEVADEDVDEGYAIVETTTAGGHFFAYASVVDNLSGDPVYIPALVGDTTEPGGGEDEIIVTLPGGVPLVMVRIPAGTFMMGSPTDESGRVDNEDLHEVTLTRDYYMGRVEVTQAQWQAVMGSNPASGSGEGDDYPVYQVSWDDIAGSGGFIERLNQFLGTSAFRLPTEAEWERAARAGTQTRFSHGDADECDNYCGFCDLHDRYMVWCGNASGQAETGSKLPNAYGLHNMHGNVLEWVQDWYTESLGTLPQTDPTGPTSGADRVLRGGCFRGNAYNDRSATRRYGWPSYRRDIIGFRLAMSE